MKKNLVQSILLLGGIALISLVISCSKEQPMTDRSKIKKTSVATLAQDFIDEFEAYDASGTASTVPTIEYDHAIWLVEAALNYKNSVSDEEEAYIDYSSPYSNTSTLNWAWNEAGEEALVSKKDLFDLFDDFLETNDNKVPMSNVKIFDGDGFSLDVMVSGFGVTNTLPSITVPIGTNDAFTSVFKGTCNPSAPSGSSNSVAATKNAADRITEAFGPYAYENAQQIMTPAALYGWYHTIIGAAITTDGAQVYTIPAQYNWVSHNYSFVPGQGFVFTIVGTGVSQHEHFWGGNEVKNSLTTRDNYECLGSSSLISWKDAALGSMEGEANAADAVLLYDLGMLGKSATLSGTLYHFHDIVFVTGQFSTHAG